MSVNWDRLSQKNIENIAYLEDKEKTFPKFEQKIRKNGLNVVATRLVEDKQDTDKRNVVGVLLSPSAELEAMALTCFGITLTARNIGILPQSGRLKNEIIAKNLKDMLEKTICSTLGSYPILVSWVFEKHFRGDPHIHGTLFCRRAHVQPLVTIWSRIFGEDGISFSPNFGYALKGEAERKKYTSMTTLLRKNAKDEVNKPYECEKIVGVQTKKELHYTQNRAMELAPNNVSKSLLSLIKHCAALVAKTKSEAERRHKKVERLHRVLKTHDYFAGLSDEDIREHIVALDLSQKYVVADISLLYEKFSGQSEQKKSFIRRLRPLLKQGSYVSFASKYKLPDEETPLKGDGRNFYAQNIAFKTNHKKSVELTKTEVKIAKKMQRQKIKFDLSLRAQNGDRLHISRPFEILRDGLDAIKKRFKQCPNKAALRAEYEKIMREMELQKWLRATFSSHRDIGIEVDEIIETAHEFGARSRETHFFSYDPQVLIHSIFSRFFRYGSLENKEFYETINDAIVATGGLLPHSCLSFVACADFARYRLALELSRHLNSREVTPQIKEFIAKYLRYLNFLTASPETFDANILHSNFDATNIIPTENEGVA